MPITVQQFDFIAATQGINQALAAAEEAGGITGTRDVPTQIELGSGGKSGLHGTMLSGADTEYMPGTVVTDTSQGIGQAGTQASGQILGGGGLIGGPTSSSGMRLQDLMDMYQEDTSLIPGFKSNAPVASSTVTPASYDQQILNRAQAGELISGSDLATMEDGTLRTQAARAVLNNWIGEMTRLSGEADFDGVKNSFRSIYDLWQNFFDTTGDIEILMNEIAMEGGHGENYFAGMERALQTAGEEFTLPGGQQVAGVSAFAQGQKDNITAWMRDISTQTNDWTLAMTAIARSAFTNQDSGEWKEFAGNNGVPDFGSEREAYNYFSEFFNENIDSFGEGALGTEDRLGSLAKPGDYISGFDSGTQDPTVSTASTWMGGAGTPGPGGIPAATEIGGLGAAGLGAENRTFGDVFPGFVSTSPYADIPNIGSAIRGAQPFFAGQYAMEAPFIPQTPIPAGESRAGNWLRGLAGGETGLLRGNPLAERLQAISTALGQPAGGSIGELGSGASENLLRGLYADPNTPASAAQVSAFQNPFYLATRGAPTSRALAMNAITKAATDFAYKYPSGIPTAEGTTPEQFLPWALRTNLMGIQDLPEFQGMNWG